MTLFKKVFGSHAVGNPSNSTGLAVQQDAEFDDAYAQDAAAQDTKGDGHGYDALEDDDPAMDEGQPPEDEQLNEEIAELIAQNPPPVEIEPTMAERAALAHEQIENSQRRLETGRNPAPPPPDTVDAGVPVADPVGVASPAVAPAPAPEAMPRPGRTARRARTRLLGFDQDNEVNADPFEKVATDKAPAAQVFPVGWFVIVSGPGKGHAFAIFNGASTIGRGEDQAIRLDFGDTSISRQNHAAVAYDDEQNKFYLGHGGKSNIIRLNDRPVLSTEELSHADILRIGETKLRFVAFCGDDFKWGMACNDEV